MIVNFELCINNYYFIIKSWTFTIIIYQMSLILQKYKNKRRLGKGAYGDVLLVSDPNDKQMAIKMISKKMLQKDPYLQQYLDGEKDVMMSVKDRYVVELYAFEQDQNYKYFICEYCDGGDLLNYQATQPNKVFNLKLATQILSQVIQGLEMLHYKGYLHRDIKPANILLKKTQEQGKYIFKLADFGFAKKSTDVGGTVLGTQQYMSPQIFSNEIYSYQVDMWAFGVLFYFMLNMQLPFVINPHATIQMKRESLIKQATNFSYSEKAKTSKKKIMENCTPQVEDLFKKMFQPNGQKRINFVQIRQHPLFRQYFPVIETQSRILYKNKRLNRYDSFVQQKTSGIYKTQPKTAKKAFNEYNMQQINMPKVRTDQEKQIVEVALNKICFLLQVSQYLPIQLNFIDPSELTVFRYNLLKYYVMLLRDFHSSLQVQTLDQKYPKHKWKQFLKTPEFSSFKNNVKQKLNSGQVKHSHCYSQCLQIINSVRARNPYFQRILEGQVSIKQFQGQFKQSYRMSTNYIYTAVRQKFSENNKYVYYTALAVMCHAFNSLIQCSNGELTNLFSDFINEKNKFGKNIQFIEVKNWLATTQKQNVKNVIKNILNTFF